MPDVFDQLAATGTASGNPGTPPPDKPGMTPLASGASQSPAGGDSSSGDIFDQLAAANAPNPGAIHFGPNDGIGTTVAKGLGAIGEGAGQGLLSGINGIIDMGNKVADYTHTDRVPQSVSDTLQQRQQELAADNKENPTLNKIGYGGETLAEFMMGDEALKALPMSERLLQTAKTMKIFEKSPKLMQALKIGAEAANTGARTGVVQGAQTLARTGGDVKQAASDAATAGVVGGATGAVTGALGNFLSKGGKAAQTVQGMSDAATNAPTEQGVFGSLADHINQEKSKVDEAFSTATQSASDAKDQAVGAADAAKTSATQGASDTFSNQKNAAEDLINNKKEQDASFLQDNVDRANRGLQASKKYIQTNLVSGLDQLSSGAADTEDLAGQVNNGINEYEKASHTDFEEGLNGDEGVITRLDGQTVPVSESPVSTEAQKLLNTPNPADHPAVAGMKSVAGDKIDASVKQKLQELADGVITKGEGENATTTKMPDWTAKDLVQFRQSARQAASGYMRGDINRRVLGDLINSVDDTLEQMADKAGDPEAIGDYKALRNQYKTARANLDTSTADKLNLKDNDQGLNDVSKYLTGGNNSLAKLSTIRKIVGDGTMQDLAKSKVAQWKELAQSDPAKFVKEFGAMTDGVKKSFFGDEMTKGLQSLADTYNHLSEYADSNAKSLIQSAKASGAASKAVTRQIGGNTGPGAQQLGGLIGEGIKSANKTALEDISSRYDDAVSAAQDAYDSATTDAKGAYDAASEPFKGAFMKNLAEGRINDSLSKGQVDAADISNLKQAVGDKWNGIADGIFQRAVADASPAGRFDPEKMVKWWSGIKPDVRSELFSMDDPANLEKYQGVMGKVEDSAAVKRMVKYFGAYPVVGGTAAGVGAAVGAAAGPAVMGHLSEMLGGIAGVAGGAKVVKSAVEWVANHPNTWRALAKASDVANSKAAGAAADAARAVAAKGAVGVKNLVTGNDSDRQMQQRRNAYAGAAQALGGNSPTPATHVFNPKTWAAHPDNKGQDVNLAIAKAKQQGFKVVN